MEMKIKLDAKNVLLLAIAAGLFVWFLSGLMYSEPFSDEQLQRMQFESTRGMPQDR